MVEGTEMSKGIMPESEIAGLCASTLVHLPALTVWMLFPGLPAEDGDHHL